jgi:hypothetical protein
MQNQMQHFFKNVTIIGGLLALAAAGAGRWSLDALLAQRTRGEASEAGELSWREAASEGAPAANVAP